MMTEELRIAIYAALLGLFQLCLAAWSPLGVPGYLRWNTGPRDTPFDVGPVPGRLRRAFQNFMETYVFFAVIVIALTIVHRSDPVSVWGARIYLIARVVYIPCYAFAVSYVRSAVWCVSFFGILATACCLLF